jgi:hypothetical protein
VGVISSKALLKQRKHNKGDFILGAYSYSHGKALWWGVWRHAQFKVLAQEGKMADKSTSGYFQLVR